LRPLAGRALKSDPDEDPPQRPRSPQRGNGADGDHAVIPRGGRRVEMRARWRCRAGGRSRSGPLRPPRSLRWSLFRGPRSARWWRSSRSLVSFREICLCPIVCHDSNWRFVAMGFFDNSVDGFARRVECGARRVSESEGRSGAEVTRRGEIDQTNPPAGLAGCRGAGKWSERSQGCRIGRPGGEQRPRSGANEPTGPGSNHEIVKTNPGLYR
jgi:hypothetical protein